MGKSAPPPKYPPLSLWAPFLLQYLRNLKTIPHLASASPEIDHLLNEVEKALNQQTFFYPSSKNFGRYYAQWIPLSERARLLSLYNKTNQADFHRKMAEHVRKTTPHYRDPATPFNPENWCGGDDDLKVFLAYRVLDSNAIENNEI